jgi:hypothetical protein
MLQDPDKPTVDWEEIVTAKNIDTARSKCEAIVVNDPLVEVFNVTQLTKTPNKNGEVKFVCWFKGEI